MGSECGFSRAGQHLPVGGRPAEKRRDAIRFLIRLDEPAVLAVGHEIRCAAGSRRDHREPESEGLQIDQPEALVSRRPGEQVRGAKELREFPGSEVLPHPETAFEHAMSHLRLCGIGGAADRQLAFRGLARRFDQFENPLAAREPAEENDPQWPGFLRALLHLGFVRQVFGKRASAKRVPSWRDYRRRNGAPPEFERPVPAPPAGCEDSLDAAQERPL